MKRETTDIPGMFANLGKTLARIRERRGVTQAQVARLAGIGKSQLSKYENGKELPKLDSLEKVLLVLNVGHFEFFRCSPFLIRGKSYGFLRQTRWTTSSRGSTAVYSAFIAR